MCGITGHAGRSVITTPIAQRVTMTRGARRRIEENYSLEMVVSLYEQLYKKVSVICVG